MANEKAGLRPEDLARFTGSTEFYGTMFPGIIYTEGMQYVAEAGAAYWLIDAIGSWLRTQPTLREHGIIFWKLTRQERGAVLEGFHDADEPITGLRQEIEYTDFPLPEIAVWAAVNHLGGWTLYLPSEH